MGVIGAHNFTWACVHSLCLKGPCSTQGVVRRDNCCQGPCSTQGVVRRDNCCQGPCSTQGVVRRDNCCLKTRPVNRAM